MTYFKTIPFLIERTVEVLLDFLKETKHLRTTYRDGEDAHWQNNPTSYQINTRKVTRDNLLELQLAPGGGTAISIKVLKYGYQFLQDLKPKSPMLKYYQQQADESFSRKVRQKLEEMVIAHKIINVDADTSLPDEVSHEDLPVLSDDHEIWVTADEIETFLNNLQQDIKFSRSMTSDACYIDPDNPDQCL